MIAIGLDREALEHARSVVARESPTPRQELRFQITGTLSIVTILLVIVWVIAALGGSEYQSIFINSATVTCLLALGLLPSNAGFAYRLWCSYLSAYRLGLLWRARWSLQDWAWLMFLVFVHLCGYPILALGVFGLVEETQQHDLRDLLLLAVPVAGLGVGCLLLPPMELARRRVSKIATLRGPLHTGEKAALGKLQVPAVLYDRITDLEFEQTSLDSHRSLMRVPPADVDASIAVRLGADFQRSVEALPDAQGDRIYDLIGELDERSLDLCGPGTGATLPVPGTRFCIRIWRRSETSEIEIVSLESLPQ